MDPGGAYRYPAAVYTNNLLWAEGMPESLVLPIFLVRPHSGIGATAPPAHGAEGIVGLAAADDPGSDAPSGGLTLSQGHDRDVLWLQPVADASHGGPGDTEEGDQVQSDQQQPQRAGASGILLVVGEPFSVKVYDSLPGLIYLRRGFEWHVLGFRSEPAATTASANSLFIVEWLSRCRSLHQLPAVLPSMADDGVPAALRSAVWLLASGGRMLAEHCAAMDPPRTYAAYRDAPADDAVLANIAADVNRTFTAHPRYAEPDGEGRESLARLLRAYAAFDPAVGFKQGMAFVGGVLLAQRDGAAYASEEAAFWTLAALMGPPPDGNPGGDPGGDPESPRGRQAAPTAAQRPGPGLRRLYLTPDFPLAAEGVAMFSEQVRALFRTSAEAFAAHAAKEEIDTTSAWGMLSHGVFTTVGATCIDRDDPLRMDHLGRLYDALIVSPADGLAAVMSRALLAALDLRQRRTDQHLATLMKELRVTTVPPETQPDLFAQTMSILGSRLRPASLASAPQSGAEQVGIIARITRFFSGPSHNEAFARRARGGGIGGLCPACRLRPSAFLLLPCRHLGFCSACRDAPGADVCALPGCGAFVTSYVTLTRQTPNVNFSFIPDYVV